MEGGIAFYECQELELLDELKNFSRVEIPGDMLDDAEFNRFFPENSRYKFQIRELLSRKIVSDLPDLPFRVCRELLALFEQRCEKMAKSGIRNATLTPDICRSAADEEYAGKLKDILLCMAGICSRHNIDLSFELRIPENFESAIILTRDFLRKSSLYTRLMIDFHLHEPKSFEILPQVAETFPFKSDCWRLSFELKSCNYLSAEAVKRVMAVSRQGSWEQQYMIFAPGSCAGAENYRQLDLLAGECFHG